MRYSNLLACAGLAFAAITSSTPASAVVTTFATFSTDTRASNLLWTSNGTGGTLVSTSTDTATGIGASQVVFAFTNLPDLAALTNVSASFQLIGTAPSGNPATLNSGVFTQGGINGSFSFITTQAIVVGSSVFAAGSNLLGGVFTGGTIVGPANGTAASFSGITSFLASDFVDLSVLTASEFSIPLGNVTPSINATPNNALSDFRARTSGAFSGDGLAVAAVPEPATWAMMIGGFGLVGCAMRRRRSTVAHYA